MNFVSSSIRQLCPALSVTAKQASNSSTDQGGGKRRVGKFGVSVLVDGALSADHAFRA